MPIIRIELLAGRTVAQKRAFAQEVTGLTADILGCGRDAVSVIFEEVEPHNWSNGGRLESDKAEANV